MVTIGIGLGARYQQNILPFTSKGTSMPAWIDITIEEVIHTSDRYFSCIAIGMIDPKYAEPRNGIRLLLRSSSLLTKPESGDRLVGTVELRLPQRAILPGTFSEWHYCVSHKITLVARAVSDIAVFPDSNRSHDVLWVVQQSLTNLVQRVFESDNARRLAEAMVLGRRERLGRLDRELFSITGTAHVLSVSGFHVGVITTIVLLLTAPIGQRRTLRYTIILAITWLYVAGTGAASPSVRAGTMATIAMAALYLQRWLSALHILWLAAVVMLIIEPVLILSVAFHLSVMAVAGIIVFGKSAVELAAPFKLHAVARWILALLVTTIGATLATAPILAIHFGVIPLVGIIANLITVPLATVFIITTIVAMGVESIVPSWGMFYGRLGQVVSDTMLSVLHYCAESQSLTLRGQHFVYTSIVAVVLSVYILRARDVRAALFRTGISAIAVVLTAFTVQWFVLSQPLDVTSPHYRMRIIRNAGANAIVVAATPDTQVEWMSPIRSVAQYCRTYNLRHVYVVTDNSRTFEQWSRYSKRLGLSSMTIVHDSTTVAALLR
ncbi:MAG: ComEC/Rec2 family competence protein [Chlorobi bacterium]|nr:ComEC/Rec2 family competence protein [Chlorobiota bacterium]